jgi:ribosomal protein S18 acetylase RimI-like enzyme
MKLHLIPFKQADLVSAYDLYKKELHGVISSAFGWDEVFQKNRFTEKYHLEWFYWIEAENVIVGYVCFNHQDKDLHISLLIIDEQFQGKGIGKKAMIMLNSLAYEKNLKVTLSSFKSNQNAISFYQTLGFKIIRQDEHFFDFELDEK